MPIAGDPEAAEDAQHVRGEGRRGNGREQQRIATFAANDDGQEADHERGEEACADGADGVEAEVAAERPRGVERRARGRRHHAVL